MLAVAAAAAAVVWRTRGGWTRSCRSSENAIRIDDRRLRQGKWSGSSKLVENHVRRWRQTGAESLTHERFDH
ncbi:hypothetical protein E4U53_003300 [Claviceps sorghi]|nr:hypothetical protein E4U53_003300 [Claviceps sorghi]